MNDDYYEYTYINDGDGNVNGIKFIHISNPNPLTNTFKIEVGRHYSLYDIGGVIPKPMHNIVVVRIDDRNIYYKVIKDFTGTGEISQFISNIRLGTAEHFMPVTNISGTNTTKRLFRLSLHPGVNIHEGGRKKRGRKSKKYSKTKSKSRTRRGGRRSHRSHRARRIKCKSRR
jgi:hypothetical protein